eukprot:gene5515-8393_t
MWSTYGEDIEVLPPRAPWGVCTTSDTLRLATYNVWFRSFALHERAEAVVRLLRSKAADVVCLQEVTQEFMSVVLENDFIRDNCYVVLDPALTRMASFYGLMMLSTHYVGFPKLWDLRSPMGRKLG